MTRILALPGPPPRLVQVVSTGDPWAGPELRREVATLVERAAVSKQLQANTVAESGPRWLEQALDNLARIGRRPSVASLAGAFAGRPAVLVSPGPSLARNVQQLAGLRGRALIVSGTHPLALLRRHGVRPDLVVAADAGDLVRHWQGTPPGDVGALALSVVCRAELFELPTRQQFTFEGNADIEGWIFAALGESAHLPTGGSVACSAVSLALAMGCDPLVLVGQDLAFDGGRYYAAGGLDEDAGIERNADGTFFLRKPGGAQGPGDALADGSVRFTRDQRLLEVDGYGGGRVLTSQVLRAFLTWFEALAGSVQGTRLWNCTQGGARIAGFRELPLAEASAGWPSGQVDAQAVFARAAARIDPAARSASLARRVEELQADLAPCLQAARRCLAQCHPARLERLAQAEAELKRRLVPLRLLSVYAQREVAAAQLASASARSIEQNLAAARRLFEVVLQAGERLASALERAREALARAPAAT